MLTVRPPKRVEELGADQLHEAGQHDQVGLEAGDGVGQRAVPVLAARELADLLHEGRHAGPLGAGEALDVVAVGADGDHAGAVRRVRARVEKGLEVGAGAGDEHDDSGGIGGRHARQSMRVDAAVTPAPRAALPPRHGQPTDEAADAEGGDGVHQHVERERADHAHPARADGAAGDRGEHREEHPGQHAAGAAPDGALVPAQGRQPPLGARGGQRGHQRRERDQVDRPAAGAGVGQRRQQREHRQRAEHDQRGRDQRVGADGEAGTEQVGPGERDRVGHDGAAERREEGGVAGVGVQLRHHVGGRAEVDHQRGDERDPRDDQPGAEDPQARGDRSPQRQGQERGPDRGPAGADGDGGATEEEAEQHGPDHDPAAGRGGRRRGREGRGDDAHRGVPHREQERPPSAPSSRARRRRSGRRPGRGPRPSPRRGGRSATPPTHTRP